MSDASVANWLRLMNTGELKNKTVRVLDYIYANPNTDINQMREALKISHQSLTAVVSNIMDEGLVKFAGERVYGETTYSTLIFVQGSFSQAQEKARRTKEKFTLWLKQGEHFKDLMSSQMQMCLAMEQSMYE